MLVVKSIRRQATQNHLTQKLRRAVAVMENIETRILLSGVSFGAPTAIVGNTPLSVVAVDVNGDGIRDLISSEATNGKVSIALGNGDGTFQAAQKITVGVSPESVVVADLNGDGIPDIVTVSYTTTNPTVNILIGNGDGSFKPVQNYAIGNKSNSVAVADINHDGKLDLITVNSLDNDISILLGNGDGSFKPQQTIAVGNNPFAVAVGDFSGDKKPDLVVSNKGDGTLSILLGNNDGTFKAATVIPAGTSPRSITVADVNNDRRLDLIVTNQGTSNVSLFLGNGNGTFKPHATLAVGTNPVGAVAIDVNGDHIPDLLVADAGAPDNANISILLGNGNGTFKPQQTLGIGSIPLGLSVTDLNRDGKPDLVVLSGSNSALEVSLNTPTVTSFGSATFTTLVAGTFTFHTTGFTNPKLTETGALPKGIKFIDNHDGTAALIGTPIATAGGIYKLTISGTGTGAVPVKESFTLEVVQGLAITAPNATFTVGRAGLLTIKSTGFPAGTFSLLSGAPAGVTLTDSGGKNSAKISGKPAAGTGGVYTLMIEDSQTVGGNTSFVTQSLTLTVLQPAAFASLNSDTFAVGTVGTFHIATTGFPISAITETGTLPTGLTLTDHGNGSADLTGTPGAQAAGTYHLTLNAKRGHLLVAKQTFTLIVV